MHESPLQADISGATDTDRALVIACGALANEIQHLKSFYGWEHLDIRCIDAKLHNRPRKIPERLRTMFDQVRDQYSRILVAYADCGAGGEIQRICAEEGVPMLEGAHCYAFFSGQEEFAREAEENPATFYLTDFLARHFQRLIVEGLKLDKHPELIETIFGNYERVLYLSQRTDGEFDNYAQAAADFLGLPLEQVHTGYGELETDMQKHLIAVG